MKTTILMMLVITALAGCCKHEAEPSPCPERIVEKIGVCDQDGNCVARMTDGTFWDLRLPMEGSKYDLCKGNK